MSIVIAVALLLAFIHFFQPERGGALDVRRHHD